MDGTAPHLYATSVRKTVWEKHLWGWSSASVFICPRIKSHCFIGEDQFWNLQGPCTCTGISGRETGHTGWGKVESEEAPHIQGVVKSRCLPSNLLSLSPFKNLLSPLAFLLSSLLFCCCCWLIRYWKEPQDKNHWYMCYPSRDICILKEGRQRVGKKCLTQSNTLVTVVFHSSVRGILVSMTF